MADSKNLLFDGSMLPESFGEADLEREVKSMEGKEISFVACDGRCNCECNEMQGEIGWEDCECEPVYCGCWCCVGW